METGKSKIANGKTELKERPPIIVVMGHVDHGKTTLLDYIRKANVAAKEAGGITQAISAYEIEYKTGNLETRKMTFIDTPGHEAFSKMRARGATAADLAILVVAADEGIKPQTEEAIKILQDTKTQFVIAMNKMDKPGANVEKLKSDLAAIGVLVEGYGGNISYQPISAKTGEGVSELLDLLVLASEVERLTYDPGRAASGFVLEARLNPKRGIDASVILKNGILRQGDPIATASASGKVRMLENFMGRAEKELKPSAPAIVVGFEKMPNIGEVFETGPDAVRKVIQTAVKPSGTGSWEQDDTTLNLIIKSSDTGSLEALSQIISAMRFEKPVRIIQEGVGDVTDGDVQQAISSRASIICFKSKVGRSAEFLAQTRGVPIVASPIIYELIKVIEEKLIEMKGEAPVGEMEILAVFNQEKLSRQLVGGKITSGVLKPKSQFEVWRKDETVTRGKILTMRQQKNEVNQAEAGTEAGVVVEAGGAIQVGDKLVVRK